MENDADSENKTLVFSQAEITALKKAIMYLKFDCEETDSLLYAGSPLINSILRKAVDADDLSAFAKDFYSKRNVAHENFIKDKKAKFYRQRGEEYDASHDDSFADYIYPFPAEF